MNSGIYSIENKNGTTYVGSSKSITSRWRSHKHDLRHNIHDNQCLQRAWNKYGEKSFSFHIVEEVNPICLIEVEQLYLNIAKNNPDRYYNITYNAEKAGMTDRKHSNETRNKISNAVNKAFENGLSDKLKMGWIRRRSEGNTKSHYNKNILSFVNVVTGDTFIGLQSDFVNKYGLSRSKVSMVISGKRPLHKNWKLNR